ncbi:SLOG family protein [Chryseomicrobium palamuruense]|uniref:SLOG family protein n=1 Tax=Chryseomicrobium palamuruense TaxID=682973 RepID=A0ABV8UUY9_9BACL
MVKKLIISGYRGNELGIFNNKHPGIRIIKKALEDRLLVDLEEGLEWVLISGQQGVEIWAAEVVLSLKKQGIPLKLSITPPFSEFMSRWKPEKQAEFRQLTLAADFYQALTTGGYQGPWQFQERDKFLLRNSDGALLVYDEEQPASPKFFLDLIKSYQSQHPQYRLEQITSYDLNDTAEQIQWKEGQDNGASDL